MSDFFLGIDLGGTNVKYGLLDHLGRKVGQTSAPTLVENGPEDLVDRMAALCREMLCSSGVRPDQVKAFGLGSPGPLSVTAGKIHRAGNLPGFDNFPIRAALSRRLELPGILENDANSAAWGEFWLGAGKDVQHMVMFTLGTGIGGGIISDGELVHGSEDNAAELGHMIIHPGGRLCSCGQRGCVEAYAAASTTAKRAQEALHDGRPSTLRDVLREKGELSCKEVFQHAQQGDALALEIIEGTARDLAVISLNMLHVTEPQMVVFSGGMIRAGDFLLERIRKYYREMLWNLKKESMQICFAALGEDAGFIGAAGLALHAWKKGRLYPIGE